MRIQKLNDRIFLFMDDNHHHENVVVIWTDDGPVVVDAFRTGEQFAAVENHIKVRGYQAPLIQIYTHWHPDHTMGNQNLNSLRCIAHRLTWEYLERKTEDSNPPDEITTLFFSNTSIDFGLKEDFSTELVINIGNTEICLQHAPGHTPDSSIIYVPEYHLVIAGDNLVGPEVEFFFPPDFKGEKRLGLENLARVYKKIRQLKPKIIIPGHGWVLPPEEMLSLNEHRYKNVLRRTNEIIQRGFQWSGGGSSELTYGENLISAWLSQANACATIDEQEALKQNVSRVLRLLSQTFDQVVLHSEMDLRQNE